MADDQLSRLPQDKGKKALMDQETPGGTEAPDPYTTVSSLAFASPSLEKRSLQTDLWSGNKANDLAMTWRTQNPHTRVPAPGSLLARKKQMWAQECVPERKSKYATATASFSAEAAARAAVAASDAVSAGHSAATASAQADIAARAAAEGSHAPMVGRKAKGEFVDAADLRENMYRRLYFRHPVLHTVRWRTPAEVDAAETAASAAAQAPAEQAQHDGGAGGAEPGDACAAGAGAAEAAVPTHVPSRQ